MDKLNKDYCFLLIGIIGAIVSVFGLWQTSIHNNYVQIYYVIGSTLLLITSIYFKLFYFIALELILIAGHGAILLGIGAVLQIALPLLLCAQLLFFYFFSGRLDTIFLLIGIIGIATLSIGFSYENQWIFFSGSLFIVIYAFYNTKNNRISLLWVVLNILFALTAVVKLSMPFIGKAIV